MRFYFLSKIAPLSRVYVCVCVGGFIKKTHIRPALKSRALHLMITLLWLFSPFVVSQVQHGQSYKKKVGYEHDYSLSAQYFHNKSRICYDLCIVPVGFGFAAESNIFLPWWRQFQLIRFVFHLKRLKLYCEVMFRFVPL